MNGFLFSYPAYLVWLPLLAVVLDLLLGDPAALPHPVRFIGWLLGRLHAFFIRLREQKLGGVAALCLALLITGGAVLVGINLPGVLGLLFGVYFSYTGLALGCLVREGRKAARLIENGSLEDGRAAVGMLVSRNVSGLDQPGLYKTLAESLSENFTDAFVAPLFWLFCTGPVGLWVYKAASTADSCWGYKHEPWTRFGWAAARLDDILAYLPARLAAYFLYFTAPDRSNWPGSGRLAEQARSMESPNSGWSMAAAAWLHNASMGGQAVYAGKVKEKPLLGPEGTRWDSAKINALLGHLPLAGLCALVVMWAIYMVFFALFC